MSHLSIGEVLGLLLEEFPDVTISKIRFLESQGLIDPERTPSGYRKFYGDDVELLRCILREQRENYLPLRVIKDRIESGEIDPTGEQLRPAGIRNVGAPDDSGEHVRSVERGRHRRRRAGHRRGGAVPPHRRRTSRGSRPRPIRPSTRLGRIESRPPASRSSADDRRARSHHRSRTAPDVLPGVLLDGRRTVRDERPHRDQLTELQSYGVLSSESATGRPCTTRTPWRSRRSPSASSTPASTPVICGAGEWQPSVRRACSTSSSSRSCASATRRLVPRRSPQLVELEEVGGRLRSAMMREALRYHTH